MNSVQKIRQTKCCPDCTLYSSVIVVIFGFFFLKQKKAIEQFWSEKKIEWDTLTVKTDLKIRKKRAEKKIEWEVVKMKHEVWRTTAKIYSSRFFCHVFFLPPSFTSFHYFYFVFYFCLRKKKLTKKEYMCMYVFYILQMQKFVCVFLSLVVRRQIHDLRII